MSRFVVSLKSGLFVAALATSACGGKTEGVEGAKVESNDKGGGAPAAPAKTVFPMADLGSAPQLVGDLGTIKLGADIASQPAGLLIDDPKKATRKTRYLTYAKEFEDARVAAYFNDGAINVVKVDFKRSVRADLDKAWGPATMIGREGDVPMWFNPKAGLRAKYEEQAFGGKPEGNIEFARYSPNEALLGKGNVAFEKADAPILGADLATIQKAYADILYVQSAEEGKKAMEGAAAMAGNAEIAKLAPKSDSIRFNLPPRRSKTACCPTRACTCRSTTPARSSATASRSPTPRRTRPPATR